MLHVSVPTRVKADLLTLSHPEREREQQAEWHTVKSTIHSLREQILLTFREEKEEDTVNARDISQKSFSPIQSEIFASQKQSRPDFKDRQHNYNNYIKSPSFSFLGKKPDCGIQQWKEKTKGKKFKSWKCTT